MINVMEECGYCHVAFMDMKIGVENRSLRVLNRQWPFQ
jgi:hypothetical protein